MKNLFISGHKEIVQLLIAAGADRTLQMDGVSPVDLARDFDQLEILQLFDE